MASSSSSGSQRRRPLAKRQPLSRRNSSLLGSLKSLVTAPLAWFAGTDDFEDSKDFQGKRRRLAGASSESTVDDDDRVARNKRMRIHSPPRDEPYSQSPAHGYLDPPGSVFQQQQHRQPTPLMHTSSIRSLSAAQPYDHHNSSNNHFRASTLSRTMSIDPPPRPLSSTSATASIPLRRDASIDSSNLVRTASRDLSMPPLSGRPSFLMRTSMTPQPLREVSEPPPLNVLNSNPTFVHTPLIKEPEPLQNGLRSSSATLGSLMDSVRRHHSPARQHSSLVFGESNREHVSTSPHPQTVIEKALHELDIYKTPLVPTRLRSSNVSATASSSNMFKSHRASNLVLMQGDGRSERLGRKIGGKKGAPLPNETKPYAGEGGMKRLLARRKQEAGEEIDDLHVDDDRMDDDDPQPRHKKAANHLAAKPMPTPPSPKANRVSVNTVSSVQSSSLRVGRSKTRNHIARPARPTKMRFSATFDEEAMDDLDELDEEAVQRKKEMDALEEAAKRAPIFKIPEGFTFAKDTTPVEIDSSGGKEPPIKTLPFSLTNVAETHEITPPRCDDSSSSISQSFATSTVGSSSQLPSAHTQSASTRVPSPFQAPTGETVASVPASISAAVPVANGMPNFFANSAASTQPIVPQPSTNGVPNFFANSSALSKSFDLPPSAPSIFNTSSTTSSNPPVPVKDAENPLWEGESKKVTESSASKSVSVDSAGSGNGLSSASTDSVTAAPAGSTPAALSLSSNEKSTEVTPTLSQPMFGGIPTATSPFSFSKPVESSVPAAAGDETPKPSMFGNTSTSITPAPLFGASVPSGVFGESSKTAPPAPVSLSGSSTSEPPQTSSGNPSFTFGQSTTSTLSTVEAPKPVFGAVEVPKPTLGGSGSGSGGFSFGGPGANGAEQKSGSAPFSFGTTGSKGAEQKPANTLFSFGNTDAKETEQKSASSMFSFAKAGEAEQKSTGTAFSFGNAGTQPDPKPAFSFGNTGKETNAKPASSPFSFGAAPSTPPPTDGNRSSPFTFGVPAPAPASVGFPFGGNGNNNSSKPFSFGQSTHPITPPKNQDLEVNMDESPTRDPQQTTKLADMPTIGSSGFSFGTSTSTPTSAFGTQSSGSTPFSFGTSSTTATAFGKPSEGNSFSFGQAAPASSGFNFGQSKPESEPTRPNTTGSFSFGTPTSAAGSAPVFPFGGPGNTSTGSTFGQSQSGSAPSSPSTFAQQPSPFSFGAPLPPVNTTFSFGSQPASPAGVNLSLPQPATPGGFGNAGTSGFGQTQQPSSPFGTSNPAAPATSATLFTIGAAPAAPAGTGARTIRKLPTRRGGAKR